MIYLWVVTLIWALSFGLIKGELTGLPPSMVAMIRMALALLVFVPFFRPQTFSPKKTCQLALVGAIQFGVMYVLYIQSYQYLQAHEVALFTITTPFFVWVMAELFEQKYSMNTFFWVCLCVAGSLVIKYQAFSKSSVWLGFALVQLANLSFAFGQVWYRRHFGTKQSQHAKAFVPMYFGALMVTALACYVQVQNISVDISNRQILVLLYLGLLPSGLGFFLWNKGAAKISSQGTLAIMNNMKIPVGMLLAFVVFQESIDFFRLIIGGALIVLALIGMQRQQNKTA